MEQKSQAIEKIKKKLPVAEQKQVQQKKNPLQQQKSYIARAILQEAFFSLFDQNIVNHPNFSFDSRCYQNIYWSFSYTQDLVMVALCKKSKIGIDIEKITNRKKMFLFAQRFFHHEEKTSLFNEPIHLAQKNFFRLWTCKEAYYKINKEKKFFSVFKNSCSFFC